MQGPVEFVRYIVRSALIRSMGFYTVANFLNAAIPFLLLPLLTSYLKTDEYGKLSLVQVFLSFIMPFISLSIHGSISIEYFRLERPNLSRHISTAILLPFISAFFFIVLIYFTGHFIALRFSLDYKWLLLLPLFALFQSITLVMLAVFQAGKDPVKYGLFQIGLTLLNLALSFLFVIVFKFSYEGRLYAILLSSVVFFLLTLVILYKMGYLIPAFNKDRIQSILKFGIPLIPHTIGGSLIAMSDRLLISKLIDNNAVGVYVVGYQVGMIMMIVQDSFNQAWAPHLFSKLANITEQEKLNLVKKTYMIMGGMVLCFLCVYALTPIIFNVFINQRYHEATQYVFWILLGFCFLGMYKTVTNYIFFQRRTYVLAYLTFGCAVFSVLMNYLFINHFGVVGAAYINTITWFLFFIFTWYLSNRIFPMPWLFFLKSKNGPKSE